MTEGRQVDLALMRGGTSRGPVLRLDAAPPEGSARDLFARALIGDTPTNGLGGGSPTTSKVVLVQGSQDGETDLEYIVGNLAPAGGAVDWSGTCGNMTAAVVPYAAMSGLLARRDGGRQFQLRNLATGGLVDVTVQNPEALEAVGAEVELATSYLDPGGSVLGRTLPTGNRRDVIEVDGEDIDTTLIDVTHPYLLLDYDQVVGGGNIGDNAVAERIERIRGTVCVQLGLCGDVGAARDVSAAVPRVVLVHSDPDPGVDVQVTAVSMGHAISTVPVTAAMSLAAAHRMEGTLVSAGLRANGDGALCVAGPAGSIDVRVTVDAAGRVTSAAVDRTARCLMRGTAWV